MQQYSADTVEIAWQGLDFGEGVAVGTFIQQTRAVPRFTKKAKGRGGIVRVYNTDESGSLTIIVDQESQLHQDLINISESERNAATRDKVADLSMTDTSSGYVDIYQNAYISEPADESRGTESGTFTWTFEYERKNPEVVTQPINLVGT